ncbi:MAG: AAA family ATPase [Thaumarchaeota archaeon]|nr:AAA family ATPase [Nitrososphaerota archaeon]
MDDKIKNTLSQIERENSIFKNKGALDPLSLQTKIIGREKQIESLVRCLGQYKQGFMVPFITVHGRSGSGKSVVIKHVCGNLDGILSVSVNLRKSRTVFGATNVMLSELGRPNIRNSQGTNDAIEAIGDAIEAVLMQKQKTCFVLVLDELDVLFYDTRGRPSDFLYRLVTLGEDLRGKGLFLCIIGVLNNGLADYELDDRVRSRIGSTEIFFEPYAENRIFDILKERARDAFASPVSSEVLEYCAAVSSAEHGDARRAIDLLRVAGEIAGANNEVLQIKHADLARDRLQNDRVRLIVSEASYHFRVVCLALAKLVYTLDKDWHKTSAIYAEYKSLVKNMKPLGSRRISELLTELKNGGLVMSQTASHGRGGYGTSYMLTVPPEAIGEGLGKEWWVPIMAEDQKHKEMALLRMTEAKMQRDRGKARRGSFKISDLISRLANNAEYKEFDPFVSHAKNAKN